MVSIESRRFRYGRSADWRTPRIAFPAMVTRFATTAAIALVVVASSVAWPAGRKSNDAGEFSSFQPPLDPPLPHVKRLDWPITAVDSFVLARLEAAGLD